MIPSFQDCYGRQFPLQQTPLHGQSLESATQPQVLNQILTGSIPCSGSLPLLPGLVWRWSQLLLHRPRWTSHNRISVFYFGMQLQDGHMAILAPPAQQLLRSLMQSRGIWAVCLPPAPQFCSIQVQTWRTAWLFLRSLCPVSFLALPGSQSCTNTGKCKAPKCSLLSKPALSLESETPYHLVSASLSSKASNTQKEHNGGGPAVWAGVQVACMLSRRTWITLPSRLPHRVVVGMREGERQRAVSICRKFLGKQLRTNIQPSWASVDAFVLLLFYLVHHLILSSNFANISFGFCSRTHKRFLYVLISFRDRSK